MFEHEEHQRLIRIERQVEDIGREVTHIGRMVKQLMADESQVEAELDALSQKVTDLGAALTAKADQVAADIQALKDELAAAGGQVPQSLADKVTALDASVSALTGEIQTIDPPAPA